MAGTLAGARKEGVRVRFAPSPTGHLHVGGARTAIYNWLLARHFGGTFVLRIDDTDPERSLPDYVEAILRGMTWLGLDWDEGPVAGGGSVGEFGPYFQSQRMRHYREAAEQLLKAGHAYRCFCSPEKLETYREQARAARSPSACGRQCRYLSKKEKAVHESAGTPFAVRFAVPLEGQTAFEDAVRGRLVVDNGNIEDFVIMRSDATPTYNFATAVDDAQMAITHVVRGDDHISNTPKQILVFEALGLPVPVFAHLPMIWGPDKKRLSKRHGATSVEAFRDDGYLPEAVLNFLALLGWSPGTEQTLFTRAELVDAFTLDRVSNSPAVFDLEKLAWMNGEYIRALQPRQFIDRATPFLQAAGLDKPLGGRGGGVDGAAPAPPDWWHSLARIIQQRLRTLSELPDLVRFLFEDVRPDDQARAKALSDPQAGAWLSAAAEALSQVEPFEAPAIESTLRALPERLSVKPKALFQAIRAVITGRLVSPPLFESIALLGKELSVARLRAGARRLAG